MQSSILNNQRIRIIFLISVLSLFSIVASASTDGDSDGIIDSIDRCQNGETDWISNQSTDADGDGCRDSTEDWDDDNDGFDDDANSTIADDCPNVYGLSTQGDILGCPDSDNDGWADLNDKFPNESTQWNDTDQDGYGDELSGYQGDSCPSQQGNSTIDKFGCLDRDGDGYSNDGDDLPDNPTQYFDLDGDGYGDNRSAGALQSDAFPMNPYQWHDNDGDGYGDNVVCVHYDAHPNDVNAWAADDECDIEDDDGFEFMIPGTKITISAWDLVGIFTGGPIAVWVIFSVATRDSRCHQFEVRLRDAKSRKEIEDIATEYEKALMLRMIGIHHGLRLERLRSEFDDVFEVRDAISGIIEDEEE